MKNAYTLSCSSNLLRVQVNRVEEFDLSVFALENQDLFLECYKQNSTQGFVEYEKGEWVSLDFFLAHSHFTKMEACSFLYGLIQALLQGLKNQPIILEPQAIFLSSKGDQIRLCRAPLLFEAWMKRQEDIEIFLGLLLNIFPSEVLEILGLLWKGAYGKESLENMVFILETIYQGSTKKSLFSRRKSIPPYCAKKPILIVETSLKKEPNTQFIKEWETKLPQSASTFFQEESLPSMETNLENEEPKENDLAYAALLEKIALSSKHEEKDLVESISQNSQSSAPLSSSSSTFESVLFSKNKSQEKDLKLSSNTSSLENATVVLEQWTTPCFLEIQGHKHFLQGEEVFVGRSVGCDICLTEPSVSSMHAKLSCQEMRWYIQDLKSTNSTWLNEKKVIRKMRLKEGMVIRFGHCEAIFHQSPLSHS